MNETTWNWARLDRKGIEALREAEGTIGADIVLVYGDGGPVADNATRLGLRPATLDASGLERLQGLERTVGAVAVAYQRA